MNFQEKLALLPERIARRIKLLDNGCWEWQGAPRPDGYGEIHFGKHYRLAHRVVYELLVGPIPPDRELDHLCRNRDCVSPMHLEVVTGKENWRRGESFTAQHARATHCPQGHPYNEQNTLWKKNKGVSMDREHPGRQRTCRICFNAVERQPHRRAHKNEYKRAWRAARRKAGKPYV